MLMVFAVYDEKVGAFAHPFFCVAVGQATRIFQEWATEGTPVAKHPADYCLYRIGMFDEQKGRLEALEPIERLGLASEYVEGRSEGPRIRLAEVPKDGR